VRAGRRQAEPIAALDDLARHTLLYPTRDHRDWRALLLRLPRKHGPAAQDPGVQRLDRAAPGLSGGARTSLVFFPVTHATRAFNSC